ncbi:hypothetical protein ACOME3_010406 [Neoechinorhynchus agilis]
MNFVFYFYLKANEEITCTPYDDDIDFIVNSTEYDRFMAFAKTILVEQRGRKVKNFRGKKQTHIQVSNKNTLSVDIFWFIDNEKSIDYQFKGIKSPKGPAKVVEFLERQYKNWQYPLDCRIRRGHNCKWKPIGSDEL